MHNKHTFCIGANTEFQNNETGGWGYILPRFKSRESGVYVQDKYFVSNDLIISAGIRLSEMHTFIYKYRDWFRSPQTNGDWDYALRSDNLEKHWNSLIFSAGINWLKGNWVIKSLPCSPKSENFWNKTIKNYTNDSYSIEHIGKYNRAVFRFSNINE